MENNAKGDEAKCDTGLVLGLNYGSSSSSSNVPWVNHNHRRRPADTCLELERSSSSNYVISLEPSLTLGLSDDGYGLSMAKENGNGRALSLREFDRRSSPNYSAMSSFSDGHPSKVKKETADTGSEETEKVASHISDDLLEDGNGRKKLRLTKEQSALLEDKFKEQSTLNPRQKQALAKQLKLQPRQVEVWFQNRRARTKFKKTKIDCEVLRKCCETLTDENRRLQKELQELKALKLPPQLYMQLQAGAAATSFTVCPSCERIVTAGSDGAMAPGALVAAPKPRFLKPFAHSAAC